MGGGAKKEIRIIYISIKITHIHIYIYTNKVFPHSNQSITVRHHKFHFAINTRQNMKNKNVMFLVLILFFESSLVDVKL